jgi:hypothetical protein
LILFNNQSIWYFYLGLIAFLVHYFTYLAKLVPLFQINHFYPSILTFLALLVQPHFNSQKCWCVLCFNELTFSKIHVKKWLSMSANKYFNNKKIKFNLRAMVFLRKIIQERQELNL